jgi:glycosyltransferase involved in cell wall biosynthesis
VEPGAFLFGVFGYLRESKRLMNVLDVLLEARRENPRIALLVAGDFVSSDLERAAEPLLQAPGVIRRAYLCDQEFWLAAASVDACINLRNPCAGETSGIAIRLMGIGKPVLVTDSPAYARFPEDACLRIAPGPSERESLRSHVSLVTSMAEVAVAIGQRGAAYAVSHNKVEKVGKLYWDLLCEHCT